jgi:hypothetical protein
MPVVSPYIISVVEIGDIDDKELEAMQRDDYNVMPLDEDHKTLYV